MSKYAILVKFIINSQCCNRSINIGPNYPTKQGNLVLRHFFLIKFFAPLNKIKKLRCIWQSTGIYVNVKGFYPYFKKKLQYCRYCKKKLKQAQVTLVHYKGVYNCHTFMKKFVQNCPLENFPVGISLNQVDFVQLDNGEFLIVTKSHEIYIYIYIYFLPTL